MLKLTKRFFAVILNPFAVLGLKETATLDESKQAYKKLVMKYHPDISKTEDTSEKFREITEAFSMVKKRIESRETIAIPKEDGFVSQRPKYDGHVSSVLRDDKVREYINFRPLDIELPQKDRLGIMYRPFFTDQDATHPKTGTLIIVGLCISVSMIYSYVFKNTVKRDETINQILYEKLKMKYKDSEWDIDFLHPNLQAAQNDPNYQNYLKVKSERDTAVKFKKFFLAPSLVERFNPEEFKKTEKPREYLQVAKS